MQNSPVSIAFEHHVSAQKVSDCGAFEISHFCIRETQPMLGLCLILSFEKVICFEKKKKSWKITEIIHTNGSGGISL